MSFPTKKQQSPYKRASWIGDSSIISKISNFLSMKKVKLADFWQSSRNYASPQDLQLFCAQCGLKLTLHDDANIKSQLFMQRQVISISDFCYLIPHWQENCKDIIAEFQKKRSMNTVEDLRNKSNKKSRILSSNSKSTHHLNRTTCTPGKARPTSTLKFQNQSRVYLQKYREKQRMMEQELSKTIQKTKNEYQYSMLLKMNQANEIGKENESPYMYRAYKNAEGNIKVRIFNLNKLEREINLKQFERQYKSIKKQTKQNRGWQKISPSPLVEPVTQQLLKNTKKKDRQQQLENLLTSTFNLTNLLKQQIKIFKLKGIYGCDRI